MTLPRIQILALGGTIATAPDASGAMQMGLGADDLVAAVPLLATLADIRAETVSRVGSHSLSFDQIHALAPKIMGLDVDGVIVTQGTDTLEETSFLLDLLVERDIPVIVTAAMRNPALTSPDRRWQRVAPALLLKGRRFRQRWAILRRPMRCARPRLNASSGSLSCSPDTSAYPCPGAGRHHRHERRMPRAPCRWDWAPTISWPRYPLWRSWPLSDAETVSKVGSHSLGFDQMHELAARRSCGARR